ncbi:MAG: alpha-galactosidase [Verrucomicrobiia bacterium]
MNCLSHALWAAGFVALAGLAAPPGSAAAPILEKTRSLPELPVRESQALRQDWLVRAPGVKAGVYQSGNGMDLVLDNGLIRRTLRVHPNLATVALDNLVTGASVIRAVKPEAMITVDGKAIDVGGLVGQPEQAYLLPEWVDGMKASTGSLQCVNLEVGSTKAPLGWRRTRHASDLPWPPPGVAVHFEFRSPTPDLEGLVVTVHYELYDGMPVLAKWITVRNGTDRTLTLDSFTSELLATAEVESAVDERAFRNWRLPPIDLLSDYSFHGMDITTASQTTVWLPDPQYTSQVNYELKMPALVVSRPPRGPAVQLAQGDQFDSFRTFVVIHDSDVRERQGLALRKAQRCLAPWTTENPIMMHVRSADSAVFRTAVDQCADVGFEMIIYTFGSGLNMEDTRPEYLARIKADVDYAHSKGIQVGAYSLLASRRVSDEHDAINPETGKPGGAIFGNSPCLGSRWGEEYFRKITHFMEQTGLDLLEHDGSYPGDFCASTLHPGHRGVDDSQWTQWRKITDLYKWCRERGIYLNVPDYYFFAGSSKTGMGYRESNWSLPRERQIILGRQNIFDGTWTKAPSMGWMFVPLVEYHGGGAAATLEPLHAHLDAYEAHLMNNFGAGVQACYRGPRLYDTEETRAVVKKSVTWFKQYRDILESDIIHLRRPDGRDIDCFLHVNPQLEHKAMAVVYNPLDRPVERTLRLPLYYAGLTSTARVREQEGEFKTFKLDRECRIEVPVRVPARKVTWLLIEAP